MGVVRPSPSLGGYGSVTPICGRGMAASWPIARGYGRAWRRTPDNQPSLGVAGGEARVGGMGAQHKTSLAIAFGRHSPASSGSCLRARTHARAPSRPRMHKQSDHGAGMHKATLRGRRVGAGGRDEGEE